MQGQIEAEIQGPAVHYIELQKDHMWEHEESDGHMLLLTTPYEADIEINLKRTL